MTTIRVGRSRNVVRMPFMTGPDATPSAVRLGTRGFTFIHSSIFGGRSVTFTKQVPDLASGNPGMGRARYSSVGRENRAAAPWRELTVAMEAPTFGCGRPPPFVVDAGRSNTVELNGRCPPKE